ncbi:MAG: LIC_10091 family protein [Gemmatimonadaceae bacterium]
MPAATRKEVDGYMSGEARMRVLSRWREMGQRARQHDAARRARTTRLAIGVFVLAGLFAASANLGSARQRQPIPDRLSDSAFWALSNELSEPAGYFRSDNLVGNEVTMQHPIPELIAKTPRGGVYLGVGPDQNFTYIAAMRPAIAFVVDIRRLNVMQHLFYKALFELSPTRADFLSRLFARPRPLGLDTATSAELLITAFGVVAADSLQYQRSLREMRDHLTKTRSLPLTDEEFAGIEYVYTAFFSAGPDLTYNFGTGRGGWGGRRFMPSYGSLMMETDGDGVARSYLATEDNYRFIKDLESRNLIIPVTGDFAGPKALRAVGAWVRDHGATVTAMYTSNVEQYLFQSETNWRSFFENVGTFPTTPQSTFIRAIFNMGYQFSSSTPGPRSVTLLCPIDSHVKAFRQGGLQSYYDVTACPTN